MTKRRNNIYLIIIIGIIILAFIPSFYYVFGLVRYPDEFGYFAHAANMLGWDWNQVSSMHGYYSFGYSIILAPIMCLIENPIIMYRVIILINMLIVIASLFLIKRILGKLLDIKDEVLLTILSAVGVVYANYLVFMQIGGLPEIMLMFTFLVIIELLRQYLEKPTYLKLILTTIAVIYLYALHMRTMACVIAFGMILVVIAISNKKAMKQIAVSVAFLILLICGYNFCKENYTDMIYAIDSGATGAGVNDYDNAFNKFFSIFTLKGIFNVIVSLAGKLFYLGMATFGLFYWGIAFLIKESIVYKFNKPKEWDIKRIVYTYILLAVAGTIALISISISGVGRLDGLFYGRYNEMLIAIVISLGLYQMIKAKNLYKGTFIILGIQVITHMICSQFILENSMNTMCRHSIIGVIYGFVNEDLTIGESLIIVYAVGMVGIVLLAYMIKKCLVDKKIYACVFVILLIQLIISYIGSYDTNYQYNVREENDIRLAMEVKEMVELDNTREVYFLYADKGAYGYIDLLQWTLGDETVNVVYETDSIPEVYNEEDILVTNVYDVFVEELESRYEVIEESNHFKVFYNN